MYDRMHDRLHERFRPFHERSMSIFHRFRPFETFLRLENVGRSGTLDDLKRLKNQVHATVHVHPSKTKETLHYFYLSKIGSPWSSIFFNLVNV